MDVPQIGQPLKLVNHKVKEKLLTALARGATYKIACGYAGISTKTLRNYLRKGEALVDMFEEQIAEHEDKAFFEFYCEVNSVESYAAIKWLDKIDKASDFHWQAAAWKLERRYPAEYGKVSIEIKQESDEDSIEKAKAEVNRLKSDNHGRLEPTES